MAGIGGAADNRAKLTMFGTEYELEASLGAMKIYAQEFRGNIEPPYTGNMLEDMLQVMREVTGVGIEHAFGLAPQVYGIAWAMARAAGSMRETWEEFGERIEHEPINYFDYSEVYGVTIQKLGAVTFRLPERLYDAIQPDEAEEAQG